ncbi:MAG: hypothetical protein OXB86_06905 [Bdellovibrionales bacterium]|nr:hypothetical protein [Bdellovibrionales bacterium]
MLKINPAFSFSMNLICVFIFLSTTPAYGTTFLRGLTEPGNHVPNKGAACKELFNEIVAITGFSSQTVRLENQMPNTELGKNENAQYIMNSEDEILGVFKEDSHNTYPPHEVAAYELCLAIGCRIVPKTEYILFNTKTGSFQEVTESDLKDYNFTRRFTEKLARKSTETLSSESSLKFSIKTQEKINAPLENSNSSDTKMGSIQVFAEGIIRRQLGEHPSDFKIYMKLLKDPESTLRQDFDEMVVFDLVTGSNDRNLSNYIININDGRLYAIDHSEHFEKPFIQVISWVLDAKKTQIWKAPLSDRMRQLILGINFSKIKPILQKHRFNSKQKKYIRKRIKKLQFIVQSNPKTTLKDIVRGMGEFNKTILFFEEEQQKLL